MRRKIGLWLTQGHATWKRTAGVGIPAPNIKSYVLCSVSVMSGASGRLWVSRISSQAPSVLAALPGRHLPPSLTPVGVGFFRAVETWFTCSQAWNASLVKLWHKVVPQTLLCIPETNISLCCVVVTSFFRKERANRFSKRLDTTG